MNGTATHYSKSQIFVQKFNFDKTPTISRVFHPKKVDNFLGKSKLNFWTKNEDFEQCVRRSSFAAEDAKCLGKRHWNIEGKSGTKENESRIEVVLFRDILGIKRYENCTIKVSGWILDGQLQNLQPSKCVSAFVSWKSCFKSASKASITLFENYPKCRI